MPKIKRNWLHGLSVEMQRPANDVIRELLDTYSTKGASEIIGIAHQTLTRHCERVGIPLQRYKQSPDRKPHSTGSVSHRSRLVTVEGKTLLMSEWSRLSGIGISTLRARLDRGWTHERAVSEKVGTPYMHKGCIK